MGIEVLLLFAVIPCAILITYAEEGCFKISSYFANCGFMLLLYACAFCGVAVISLIGGETAETVIAEEQRIDILSWERYEEAGNWYVKYIYLDDVGYKTEKKSEGLVYYNQKNEGEEDYIIRRSYDYANEIADFFFFNFISDTYSIYTTQEHIIYSK